MSLPRIPPLLATATIVAAGLVTTGCASTYGGMASANNLGAAEYRPAVLVPPERQAAYEQLLGQCRQAAFNRQVTAAHKGQEGTVTAAVTGAAEGARSGFQMSSIFKSAGLGGSETRGFLTGAGLGAMTNLAGAFASGTSSTSDETRATLLTCLRSQSARIGFTVLE